MTNKTHWLWSFPRSPLASSVVELPFFHCSPHPGSQSSLGARQTNAEVPFMLLLFYAALPLMLHSSPPAPPLQHLFHKLDLIFAAVPLTLNHLQAFTLIGSFEWSHLAHWCVPSMWMYSLVFAWSIPFTAPCVCFTNIQLSFISSFTDENTIQRALLCATRSSGRALTNSGQTTCFHTKVKKIRALAFLEQTHTLCQFYTKILFC